MSLQNIPVELKTLANWVGWKWEEKKNSRGEVKLTKPPYDLKSNGTLRHAKTDDPATWTSFEAADAAKGAFDSRFDGVGFVLPAGMGGVDFDGVIHDERVEPFVLEILKHCGNPYAETTPSGDGVRAFINAPTVPADPDNKRKFHGKKDGVEKYGAEIYFGVEPGRYLTVTGEKLEGSGDGITTPPDINLVHFLMSQFGNEKFKSLWTGDTSAYGNDQSAADLALVSMLARRLDGDRARIEKYFGASVLGQRDKWTQRRDYRERTLNAALKVKESKPEAENPLRNQARRYRREKTIRRLSSFRVIAANPESWDGCGWRNCLLGKSHSLQAIQTMENPSWRQTWLHELPLAGTFQTIARTPSRLLTF